MSQNQSFDHLDVEVLVKELDPDDRGVVSLDRVLALANELAKGRKEKTKTMWKTGKDLLIASILLAIVIVIGVYTFIALEHEEYKEQVETNLQLKADIEEAIPIGVVITDILNLTSQYNQELNDTVRALYEDWVDAPLWDQLENNGFVSTYSINNPWKFESAAWFVFTIITTIGYGNFAPLTTVGQYLVIFYSIPAIIFMGYFIKQLMNFYKACPCPFNIGSVYSKMVTIPVIFIIYLTISGVLFSQFVDGWIFTDGVYYTWVTITTIGFGDYTINDENWWENMVNLFVIVNGLFLFTFVIDVAGTLIEHITNRERWKEVFNPSILKKIEIPMPTIGLMKLAIHKNTDNSGSEDSITEEEANSDEQENGVQRDVTNRSKRYRF